MNHVSIFVGNFFGVDDCRCKIVSICCMSARIMQQFLQFLLIYSEFAQAKAGFGSNPELRLVN